MEKQNIVFTKKNNIETNEYKIYCNNREISGYEEIMSIIIRNRNEKFTFEGFTKFEIMGIKEVIINYISYLRSLSRKKEYTKVTHILTYDDKRTFYLSTENSNDLDYIEISEFKDINKIEFISYNKEFKMIEVSVEGTICLYGIKNAYGFYDINSDELIEVETIKKLRENNNAKIKTLKDKKRNISVRKRVL